MFVRGPIPTARAPRGAVAGASKVAMPMLGVRPHLLTPMSFGQLLGTALVTDGVTPPREIWVTGLSARESEAFLEGVSAH